MFEEIRIKYTVWNAYRTLQETFCCFSQHYRDMGQSSAKAILKLKKQTTVYEIGPTDLSSEDERKIDELRRSYRTLEHAYRRMTILFKLCMSLYLLTENSSTMLDCIRYLKKQIDKLSNDSMEDLSELETVETEFYSLLDASLRSNIKDVPARQSNYLDEALDQTKTHFEEELETLRDAGNDTEEGAILYSKLTQAIDLLSSAKMVRS